MAEVTVTAESYPEEYEREPVYLRPYGGIVRVMDRQLNDGLTQAQAYTEAQPNG